MTYTYESRGRVGGHGLIEIEYWELETGVDTDRVAYCFEILYDDWTRGPLIPSLYPLSNFALGDQHMHEGAK